MKLRALTQYVAVFSFMLVLTAGLAWIAGFPDWPDPFTYDHPENFTRAQ